MTAPPTTAPPTPPTLTPARKRLIRLAWAHVARDRGWDATAWLRSLPSFHGISDWRIHEWGRALDPNKRTPTVPAVTQATAAPADPDPVATDPATTGEWYSALAIARGLGIGVERVYAWALWGWLPGGPLYTAQDIRGFFRFHPLEIKHRYLTDEQWLWLVSVLAGSREGATT